MLENNHTIHLTLNGESRAFTVEPQETLDASARAARARAPDGREEGL